MDTLEDTSIDPRTVMNRAIIAIGDKDYVRLGSEFSDNIVWEIMGGATFMPEGHHKLTGRNAVVEGLLVGMRNMYDLDQPFDVSIRKISVAGGTVVIEWTVDAKTARGEPYHNEYCMVFEIEDGKIVSVREYTNTHYAVKMLIG